MGLTHPFQEGWTSRRLLVVRFWGKAGLHTHGAGEERLLSLSEQAAMQPCHSYRMCMQNGRARGFPLHILAHRTQWAQFPAMLAINPMGPVPIPLYWAALPLPHPNHTHCLAVTVSPLETCLLPWKAKAHIKHSPLPTDRTVIVEHTL